MFESIYLFLIAAIPSLIAVITSAVTLVRILSAFKGLRDDVECRRELRIITNDNKILRKQVSDLITEMRKQKYDPKI